MGQAAVSGAMELDDIQGLVARGYRELPAASFAVLSGGSRQWLRELVADVNPASTRPSGLALNVAFTAAGLAKLGADTAGFSAEFQQGMVTPHRSRVLGDGGQCGPERWDWGGPETPPVDAVVMVYGLDADTLNAAYDVQQRRWAEHGLEEVARLDTSDLDGVERFGFRDGVSQPIVDGLSKTGPEWNTVRPGEFVLGYPNEYGRYTGGRSFDLGRNGSYLVFRQLAQDVNAFQGFLASVTSDPTEQARLAAKMVGRWPSGAPLVLAPDADDPLLADANDFGYHDKDPHGLLCPIGAHARRANPRDSLDPQPGSAESIAVGKRHRLLRRGREYDDGLHFVCLNANIARQFEFVQHTWINNPHFAGLHDEPDPLVAPTSGASFRIPALPIRQRVNGLPRFVTVRGGAYFFLPGLRALRSLSA